MAGVMSISADGSTGAYNNIQRLLEFKSKEVLQIPPITRSSYPKVLVSPSFSTFKIEKMEL